MTGADDAASAGGLGTLAEPYEAMPSPTDRAEPRPGRADRHRLGGVEGRDDVRALEAVEPTGGRARVEPPAEAAGVLPDVLDHVDDCVPGLARRLQHAAMKAVAPHSAAAAECPVDDSRRTDREPPNAARKAPLVGRFDD